MSDWSVVVSRKDTKEIKRVNALNREIEAAVEIVNRKNVNYNAPNKNIKMSWPVVQQQDSPLLSERVGSTSGKDLLKYTYLGKYTKFAELMNNYPVPIYHIDYEEEEDMGYDSDGDRAPYTESYIISIWTYVADKAPVVHMYYMSADRYTASCQYRCSSSPVRVFKSCMDEGCEYELPNDYADCIVRMMDLAA
jgi:hypothetical protein